MLLRTTLLMLVASSLLGVAWGDDAGEERRAEMLQQMQSRAMETMVRIIGGSDEPKLVEKPVFRYDDQPRLLVDATLWTWTLGGRPIAFQKIEAGGPEGNRYWQYCFSSLAEQKVEAQWKEIRKFRATEPGVVYRPVPGAPAVASRGTERRRQIRELARGFSARIIPNPQRNEDQEMRLLTTPIFEYDEPKAKLLQGAVFGYSTNGTNPDLLVVFEARTDMDKLAWHYAPARMTIGEITVSYGKQKVWECPFAEPGQSEFPTWTYFQTDRKVVKEEP
jgi:hypothetical protein